MDEKVKEIEEKYRKMAPNTIDNWVPFQDWYVDIQYLLSHISTLEARVKEVEEEKDDLSGICAAALRKRKELEEGIEKHRTQNRQMLTEYDEELYKLIEERG